MAFNKSKALENALKFLNQGKVSQAIAEYQQILRNDPKDQATLMTVGDLFARQGDMPQAIEYFERLAQVYLNDGFNSKAIAIYKKIAKLAPNELAPLERLADLYVQQGVLSEARPLFLQIAEAHLKANRAPKAVEVLHRLLEVEPENQRVQMRLAELYNVIGQKKESAQTYLAYAQRLFDRNEFDESAKLVERALEVDAGNAGALLLKAKALGGGGKSAQAIQILEGHAEANAGGDITGLLLDLELKSGALEKAADRGRKQLARGHTHFAPLFKVVESMIENGHALDALPLLRELRDPMLESGEQDKFLKSLSNVAEHLPENPEPLETIVDFCRHTSNSFQLPIALSQLADVYAGLGNYQRAEELIQELIEKNKDDERLVERLNQLRARSSDSGAPRPAPKPPVVDAKAEKEEEIEEPPASPPAIIEEILDEDTQRYIAQALTDVDLFSSYGLTQKATHLLENVLDRAPRHTPTLERLLDLYLGAGNERRTAELASQLEQIHRERNDTINADRFAELRARFQKAAGMTEEELPGAPPLAATPAPGSAPVEAPVEAPEPVMQASVVETAPAVEPPRAPVAPAPAASAPAGPAEFEVPLVEIEPEEPVQAAAPNVVARHEEPAPAPVAAAPEAVAESAEVDLSDEWEAMVQEVAEPPDLAASEPALAGAQVQGPEPVPVHEAVHEIVEEPEAVASHEVAEEAEPAIEIVEEPAEEILPAETVAAGNGEFTLELTAEPRTHSHSGAATTEDFISELVAEVEDMKAPAADPVMTAATPVSTDSAPAPEPTAESLNQLAEVFQEFRNELGELGEEDEDLETHYNLGIAYREMGLLDEAIGEFQKVAKAVQKGKPFRYAMNCSTLLALTFMDKGEPKIASLWYRRALEVPGLDQEAILALRYDLGIALENAGEADAALESFRQVYAMNIDYRDVSDHIATLQKH